MAEIEPARTVLVGAARDYLRRWPFVIFWLGMVPYGWSGIVALLPAPNPPRVWLEIAYLLWASLAVPVEIQVALDILRKRPTQPGALAKALRSVPRVSSAYLFLTVPYLVGSACFDLAQRDHLRSVSNVLMGIGVACMLGSAIACLRLIAWIPAIVDRDLRLQTSLRVAWQVARGRWAWVLRVGLWLVPPLVVGVGLTARFPRFGHLAWPVVVPWLTLVWGATYLRLFQGAGWDRAPDLGGLRTDASLDHADTSR